MHRLEEIVECVRAGCAAVPSPPEQQQLQVRIAFESYMNKLVENYMELENIPHFRVYR